MKYFIVINQYTFHIIYNAGGCKNNVHQLLSELTEKEIKKIYSTANKLKVLLKRDIGRSRLLGIILIECNKAINKSTL